MRRNIYRLSQTAGAILIALVFSAGQLNAQDTELASAPFGAGEAVVIQHTDGSAVVQVSAGGKLVAEYGLQSATSWSKSSSALQVTTDAGKDLRLSSYGSYTIIGAVPLPNFPNLYQHEAGRLVLVSSSAKSHYALQKTLLGLGTRTDNGSRVVQRLDISYNTEGIPTTIRGYFLREDGSRVTMDWNLATLAGTVQVSSAQLTREFVSPKLYPYFDSESGLLYQLSGNVTGDDALRYQIDLSRPQNITFQEERSVFQFTQVKYSIVISTMPIIRTTLSTGQVWIAEALEANGSIKYYAHVTDTIWPYVLAVPPAGLDLNFEIADGDSWQITANGLEAALADGGTLTVSNLVATIFGSPLYGIVIN